MVKNLTLKVLFVIFVSACSASAFQLKNLVGSWKGHYSEAEDGDIGSENDFEIQGTLLSDGSVVLIEKRLGGNRGPQFVAKHNFKADHTYKHTTVYKSNYATGTWVMKDGQMTVSGKFHNFGGSYKLSGIFKLITSNRFQYTATYGGVKELYKAKRVL